VIGSVGTAVSIPGGEPAAAVVGGGGEREAPEVVRAVRLEALPHLPPPPRRAVQGDVSKDRSMIGSHVENIECSSIT
jgi:hypothetical protein